LISCRPPVEERWCRLFYLTFCPWLTDYCPCNRGHCVTASVVVGLTFLERRASAFGIGCLRLALSHQCCSRLSLVSICCDGLHYVTFCSSGMVSPHPVSCHLDRHADSRWFPCGYCAIGTGVMAIMPFSCCCWPRIEFGSCELKRVQDEYHHVYFGLSNLSFSKS
jgi:hypothetical protein